MSSRLSVGTASERRAGDRQPPATVADGFDRMRHGLSPTKIRLLHKVIHKHLFQQCIRFILRSTRQRHQHNHNLPTTYLQSIMPGVLIEFLPCFIALRLLVPSNLIMSTHIP
jgi:hypothetical protein